MYFPCAIFLHDVTSVNKWLITADLGSCYQLLTADVRVQSQSYPHWICGGRINTVSEFTLRNFSTAA